MSRDGELDALSVPDPDFPSGTWSGYYEQLGKRHAQELQLEFSGGRVHGEGRDGIGRFRIRGYFDSAALRVAWTKSYRWHKVRYFGVRVHDGIRGTWKLLWDEGGFHLWPGSGAAGEHAHAAARVATPAVARQPRRDPALPTAPRAGTTSSCA